MIYEDMSYKNIFTKGIDNLRFINSKLNEIMRQSKKRLKKYNQFSRFTAKITSENILFSVITTKYK